MSHKCVPECTRGWNAGRKAHCSACGENFSTVNNFDKHQPGSLMDAPVRCVFPGKAGLVLNDRGTWVEPDETDYRARFTSRANTGDTDSGSAH